MKEWTNFVERLHFVQYDGRMFAVMAYSSDDAYRQVREAIFLGSFGIRLDPAAVLLDAMQRSGWQPAEIDINNFEQESASLNQMIPAPAYLTD